MWWKHIKLDVHRYDASLIQSYTVIACASRSPFAWYNTLKFCIVSGTAAGTYLQVTTSMSLHLPYCFWQEKVLLTIAIRSRKPNSSWIKLEIYNFQVRMQTGTHGKYALLQKLKLGKKYHGLLVQGNHPKQYFWCVLRILSAIYNIL